MFWIEEFFSTFSGRRKMKIKKERKNWSNHRSKRKESKTRKRNLKFSGKEMESSVERSKSSFAVLSRRSIDFRSFLHFSPWKETKKRRKYLKTSGQWNNVRIKSNDFHLPSIIVKRFTEKSCCSCPLFCSRRRTKKLLFHFNGDLLMFFSIGENARKIDGSSLFSSIFLWQRCLVSK